MRKLLFLLFPLSIALFSCGSVASKASPATMPPHPTNTSLPTPTLTIKPAVLIIPTTQSENLIFRDDFSGSLQPGWYWENEDPEKWSFTDDGWLQITAEDPNLLKEGKQTNILWRNLPEGDFAIIVHLKAAPTADSQQAAIFVYQDADHYLALYRCFCSTDGAPLQSIVAEHKLTEYDHGSGLAAYSDDDVYLKLEIKNNVINNYFAKPPGKWAGMMDWGNSKSHVRFTKVGIGVSNGGSEARENAILVGQFDYFEIVKP
jgi:hypothetical protein